MGWCVYLLYSSSRKRSYVGCTTNVCRRLKQHNGQLVGGGIYTRRGRPWRLIYSTPEGVVTTRSEAQRLECVVKRGRGYEGRLKKIKAAFY